MRFSPTRSDKYPKAGPDCSINQDPFSPNLVIGDSGSGLGATAGMIPGGAKIDEHHAFLALMKGSSSEAGEIASVALAGLHCARQQRPLPHWRQTIDEACR